MNELESDGCTGSMVQIRHRVEIRHTNCFVGMRPGIVIPKLQDVVYKLSHEMQHWETRSIAFLNEFCVAFNRCCNAKR